MDRQAFPVICLKNTKNKIILSMTYEQWVIPYFTLPSIEKQDVIIINNLNYSV